MAISEDKATETGRLTDRFNGDANSDARRAEIEAQTRDADNFTKESEQKIIAEGDAALSGYLTEQELRNLAITLAGAETEKERLAAMAGVLPGKLIDNYYSFLRRDAETQRARDKKAQADMHYLALLQAQLAQLDAEIAEMDDDIWIILQRHLSQEELDHLQTLSPEERRREEMRLMQEKLEAGELTQAQFDAFKDRWDARAEKVAEREQTAEMINDVKNDAEATRLVRTQGLRNSEAAAETNDGEQGRKVEKATEAHADEGNKTAQNDLDDIIGGIDAVIPGESEPPSTGVSFASKASPETPISVQAPPLSEHFPAAAQQTAEVQPAAKAELTINRELDVGGPGSGMG